MNKSLNLKSWMKLLTPVTLGLFLVLCIAMFKGLFDGGKYESKDVLVTKEVSFGDEYIYLKEDYRFRRTIDFIGIDNAWGNYTMREDTIVLKYDHPKPATIDGSYLVLPKDWKKNQDIKYWFSPKDERPKKISVVSIDTTFWNNIKTSDSK